MKTLVAPKHSPGPHENGVDGCHGRVGYAGLCPGVSSARWLNDLGEDHEIYVQNITCGQMRDKWLMTDDHIVAVAPALAVVRAQERRLQAELRATRKKLKQLEKESA